MTKSLSRRWTTVLFCFGGVCLLLAVLTTAFELSIPLLLSAPLSALGEGLRRLSLSGPAGNGLAWAVFLSLSLAPCFFPLRRLLKKKRLILADGLCLLTSLYGLFYLFLLINPSYLLALFHPIFQLSPEYTENLSSLLGVVFLSFVCATVVSYLLRQTDDRKNLTKIRGLIRVCAFVGVFSLCYLYPSEFLLTQKRIFTPLISQEAALAQILHPAAPLPSPGMLIAESALPLLRFAARILPIAFLLRLVSPALSLFHRLEQDPYAAENAENARLLSRRSRAAIQVTILCSLALTLLQLVLARFLGDINFTLSLPLVELFIALIMMFLSGYFAQSRALWEENRQFV